MRSCEFLFGLDNEDGVVLEGGGMVWSKKKKKGGGMVKLSIFILLFTVFYSYKRDYCIF